MYTPHTCVHVYVHVCACACVLTQLYTVIRELVCYEIFTYILVGHHIGKIEEQCVTGFE